MAGFLAAACQSDRLRDQSSAVCPPPVAVSAPGPSAAVLDDFDGDGKLDLAVADWYSQPTGLPPLVVNSVSVMRGNGDGTFQSPVNYLVGLGPVDILTTDLNSIKMAPSTS